MNSKRGFSQSIVIGIVALLILGGGAWWVINSGSNSSGEPSMEKEGDAMMMEKDGESMEKEGDAMMEKDGDAMMKGNHMMEDGTMMKDEQVEGEAMEKDDGAMMKKEETSFNSAVIAGSSAPLLEFDQRDYETALASGRTVVLYFYANWCPLCKAEFAYTKAAFDSYTGDDLVGFRVHYKDNAVTTEMEAVAREFGVSSQHTKVFIKNGERVLKAPDTWGTERYLEEFARHTQ